MFAIFEDVGMSEILVIGIFGVLLFGKRLPEVASQAGQHLVKFRRSLQQARTDSGLDQEVRKIQRTFQEAIPHDLSVGEVARLASARVQERVAKARKGFDDEIAKPVADALELPDLSAPSGSLSSVLPEHEPAPAGPPKAEPGGAIGPAASDATIARTRPPGAPAPEDEGTAPAA
ncbi:MAG: twin-arginine translocase TatA/TatE family subunit [Planctomycetes bacterium]|nr:twin-arginine translocase TatA/TatE family subunit [Planctomycetota bacterium]